MRENRERGDPRYRMIDLISWQELRLDPGLR
jgi:hypothetical protein